MSAPGIMRGARLASAACVVLFAFTVAPVLASETEETRIRTFIEAEQVEYRSGSGEGALNWEAQGWIGGDYHKAWLKTRGNHPIDGVVERTEWQILYSRAVTAFWDVQIGGRYDAKPDPSRGYAVLGLQGLAPYFFEVDAAAFVSNKGDVSARIEAEYDLLLTQRLIAKPTAELNVAAQEVEELGTGSGVSKIELGLRLRYEIVREIAPYIGVSWERKVGPTADLARRAGTDVGESTVVAGLRFWY